MEVSSKNQVTNTNIQTNKTQDTKLSSNNWYDLKKESFYNLIGWLKNCGFQIEDTTQKNTISEIEFQAKIIPLLPYSSGLNTPLYLEYQNDLDDGFIIRTTFELDKNIELYLEKQERSKEIELTYIQIKQLVLPLKISLIRSHPFINLYKIIFYENIQKQFLLDSINDLINSMELITGKWDEKYYSNRPIKSSQKVESEENKRNDKNSDILEVFKK